MSNRTVVVATSLDFTATLARFEAAAEHWNPCCAWG
jgi:hypothetical protein